jgi:hypothetical protein
MKNVAGAGQGGDSRLGSLAVRLGLITSAQLQTALAEQARSIAEGKLPRQIGLILLSKGVLDETQLDRLVRQQEEERKAQSPGGPRA